MLGAWNTTSVYLELKDDKKSVWSHPYPVPRVHKTVLKKWVNQLVSLGVLKHKN